MNVGGGWQESMQRIGLWVRAAVDTAGAQPTRECWKSGFATKQHSILLHGQEVLLEQALARKSRKEVRGGQARQTLM